MKEPGKGEISLYFDAARPCDIKTLTPRIGIRRRGHFVYIL